MIVNVTVNLLVYTARSNVWNILQEVVFPISVLSHDGLSEFIRIAGSEKKKKTNRGMISDNLKCV